MASKIEITNNIRKLRFFANEMNFKISHAFGVGINEVFSYSVIEE